MNFGKVAFAALLAAGATAAPAAIVTVDFGGTFATGAPLAGTNFTGSFKYDDASSAVTTISSQTTYNPLTTPFTFTTILSTSSVSAASAKVTISSGTFDVFGFYNTANPGQLGTQELRLVSNLFGPTSLPSAATLAQYTPNSSSFAFEGFSGSGPLAYVRVNATGAVPEPASWAMMVGGFGLIGSALRRRKTSIAFA